MKKAVHVFVFLVVLLTPTTLFAAISAGGGTDRPRYIATTPKLIGFQLIREADSKACRGILARVRSDGGPAPGSMTRFLPADISNCTLGKNAQRNGYFLFPANDSVSICNEVYVEEIDKETAPKVVLRQVALGDEHLCK